MTKLWCLTCGRQCLPRLLEHLYRVHVCVYAIRGLEGCPFGSICIIQRLDVTQSIQAYLHYVKETIRDVKSYIHTHRICNYKIEPGSGDRHSLDSPQSLSEMYSKGRLT